VRRLLAALAVLLALSAAVFYGIAAGAKHWFPYGLAAAAYRTVVPESPAAPGGSRLAEREAVRRLSQLPYLQGYNPAGNESGVTVYDAGRAFDGWNLCVSAHAAQAELLDMRGSLRHRWSFDSHRLWPNLKVREELSEHDGYWRRALLLPGGDLVVIWEYVGMARLDRNSRVRWALRNGANHDLAVDRDGRIYTLTREIHVVPEINAKAPVFEDFVTILSPDGRTAKSISLLRSFERSDYAPALAEMKTEGDVLHANAVQVLDGSLAAANPAFAAGNLLVSIHALGLVAVLDPRSERIVWALSGQWMAQHTPRLLDSGRLLLFDNVGSLRVGRSRVLEVDPLTQRVVWRYGDEERERMFSDTHGAVQRLPNGNTLIVESNNGRAIEVTPGKQIVWEYFNPYRVGARKELIATLPQVERMASVRPGDWTSP